MREVYTCARSGIRNIHAVLNTAIQMCTNRHLPISLECTCARATDAAQMSILASVCQPKQTVLTELWRYCVALLNTFKAYLTTLCTVNMVQQLQPEWVLVMGKRVAKLWCWSQQLSTYLPST